MLARMWTHGWDMFTPATAVVYHLWTRSYRPTIRENFDREKDVATEMRNAAQARVKGMLTSGGKSSSTSGDSRSGADRFGLGDVRSMEDFQAFCGVDFRACTITERGKLGGQAKEIFRSSGPTSEPAAAGGSGGTSPTAPASSAAAQVFQLLQMKGLLG